MKRKMEIFLCFDIPRRKNSLRVKIWRSLNEIGAKKRTGSIWSLSYSIANIQEFKRMAEEINLKGGKAELFLGNVIRITSNKKDAHDKNVIRITSEKRTNVVFNKKNVIRITREIDELVKKSVIILDKPSGPTSREVTEEVKRILGCKKAGNTGILDPRASGVLVVVLEKALKIMPLLMGLNKEYEGVMYLHKHINPKILEETISRNFIGEITQVPPVKSRVARKPRKRIVYSFDVLKKDGQNVKFKTKVQAGLYVRKLCSDIGEKLGIKAHLKELRRTKVGHFSIKDSYSIDEIRKACEAWKNGDEIPLRKILIPIEKTIPHVKKVHVKDSSIERIRNGAPVLSSDIIRVQPNIKPKETIGIFSLKNELIALGIAKTESERMLGEKKKSVIRTDRVL